MPARIIIDNRVRVLLAELPESVLDAARDAFTHKNQKRAAMKAMGLPYHLVPKEILTWEVCSAGVRTPADWVRRKRNYDRPDAYLSLPRGGLAKLRLALEKGGVDWVFEDRRESGAPLKQSLPEPKVVLREHQERMVRAALAKENCILHGSVGCGKTEALLALVQRADLPALVLVRSGALHDQWLERVQKTFGVPRRLVGIIRGSTRTHGPITIAMHQSMDAMRKREPAEFAKELRRYGFFGWDEVQQTSPQTAYDTVDPFPSRFRVGVSADSSRKDGLGVLVEDLFGEVAEEVGRSEMIREGFILEVEVRVVPTDFRADWYGYADDHDPDREVDFDRLLNEMRADDERNALACRWALHEALEHQQPTFVFCARRDHCHLLSAEISGRGVRTGLLIGGQDYAPQFRETLRAIRKGALKCAVGTLQATGTGLDFPDVAAGVAASPFASNKQQAGQLWGRMCRTKAGKTGARLYALWDRHVYPKHLANIVAWFPRVLVWDGEPLGDGAWADGREYLRRFRSGAA
jgi:superfamily II DNA or RNA helicase